MVEVTSEKAMAGILASAFNLDLNTVVRVRGWSNAIEGTISASDLRVLSIFPSDVEHQSGQVH